MEQTASRIFFVHLLNNYSGSPMVLRQVIQACRNAGRSCRLLKGNSGGILDDLSVEQQAVGYRYSGYRFLTLVSYLMVQWRFFLFVLFKARRGDTVYINTLLPFGAAPAARWRRCRIVYHVHETSVRPNLLKCFLRQIVERYADKVIFVSDYAYRSEKFKAPREQLVIHNSCSSEFEKQTTSVSPAADDAFHCLLACSPKAYKGIFEFFKLAEQFQEKAEYRFSLVLGISEAELSQFRKKETIPDNITVYACRRKMLPLYMQSHLVLNLSRPDEWVETFGLTILEAMHCGIPVIVPPVGGPAELVRDGIDGFHLSCYETDKITEAIISLKEDHALYRQLSANCRLRAQQYNSQLFSEHIIKALS